MDRTPYFKWLLLMLFGITAFRLGVLFLSPLGLHGDEAQYWAWSKDLDWGYFTKPPLIAWVIWTTTSLFGDAEWAVRLSSAPIHALTALVIFFTSRKIFDDETGFWAALIYFLMPAVWLSSQIVSTDVVLLFCYALALNAWANLRSGGGWLRVAQLGVFLGLGFLAKYAMAFFLPGLLFALICDEKSRRALFNLRILYVFAIAALIITPNLLWNMKHDFATFSHTAANTNMRTGGVPFNPSELIEFFISQFAVFGPVSFASLIFGAVICRALKHQEGVLIPLLVFSLSPLLIISIQALLSRANANWAVTTYVAGAILVAHFAVTLMRKVRPWVVGGIWAQSLLSASLLALVLFPSLVNQLGRANDLKRLRGWPQTVHVLENVIARGHGGNSFQMVATDKRIVFYDLLYYGLTDTLPLYMWKFRQAPENHAELVSALPPTQAENAPVLIVHYDDKYEKYFRKDFSKLYELAPIRVDLGGGKTRALRLWAGYGYTPTDRIR